MAKEEPKRLRITSDGTVNGTKVFSEDGTPVGGVMRLELVFDANNGSAIANCKLHVFPEMIDVFIEKTGIGLHTLQRKEVTRQDYEIGSEGVPVRNTPKNDRVVQVKVELAGFTRWLSCKMSELKIGDTFRMFEGPDSVRVEDGYGRTEWVVSSDPEEVDGVWGVKIEEARE